MKKIRIHYGPGNTLSKEVPDGTTFGQVLGDKSFQVGLGFGENCQALVDGAVQPEHGVVEDDDDIHIEKRVGTKQS